MERCEVEKWLQERNLGKIGVGFCRCSVNATAILKSGGTWSTVHTSASESRLCSLNA